MYHKNIDLILTFLGLFPFTNVFGTPEASSLAKNQTSISETATESWWHQFENCIPGELEFF